MSEGPMVEVSGHVSSGHVNNVIMFIMFSVSVCTRLYVTTDDLAWILCRFSFPIAKKNYVSELFYVDCYIFMLCVKTLLTSNCNLNGLLLVFLPIQCFTVTLCY